MHASHPSRYSLLAVIGAGFFVSAPIATWLLVGSITAPDPTAGMPLTLDVAEEAHVDVAPVDVAPVLDEPLDFAMNPNLHLLAQQARIVPAFQNGRAVGFKLFSIRPSSDFARAGLHNGDVVTRINGIELSSPERALEAYQRANDGLIVVDFLRRGERGTLTHHLPPLSPSQLSPSQP